MSITIHWKRTAAEYAHFNRGTSGELDKLKEVFSDDIRREHIDTLRAMSVASGSKFYDEVADVVDLNGAIKIYEKYCDT